MGSYQMITRKVLIIGDATSTSTTYSTRDDDFNKTYSGTADPGTADPGSNPVGLLYYLHEESRYYDNLLKGLKLSFKPSWSFEEELKKKIRFLYNNPIIKVFRKDRLIGRREKRIGRKR